MLFAIEQAADPDTGVRQAILLVAENTDEAAAMATTALGYRPDHLWVLYGVSRRRITLTASPNEGSTTAP